MRRLVGVLVILAFLALVAASGIDSGSADLAPANVTIYSTETESNKTLPECVIDLDCGVSYFSNLTCSRDFVVRYYFNYSCVGAGTFSAKCENSTRTEFLNWCNPVYDECHEGYLDCQPKRTCGDGILDCHDGKCEEDVDCGGPCDPCPSCYNGIQDCHGGMCERGVDCGGPCHDCVVGCASDLDCGGPRLSELYCGRDGNVYQNTYVYKCIRPGLPGSWCKTIWDEWSLVDYCGPLNPCVEGECSNPWAREWDAIETGGVDESGQLKMICGQYGCFDERIYYNQSIRNLIMQEP